MALIYAARDELGGWHGEFDSRIDWSEPRTGVLVVPADAYSPFAGQRMTVRYAAMEGSPGSARLELEDGGRMFPTVQLETALFGVSTPG